MRKVIHQGRVGVFGLETVTLPNGLEVTLEILRHPGAAAVLPLHEDGTVTLIRQYRHAGGGMIIEIPAGKLDPGESPEEAAGRELEEEAGLRAGKLLPLIALKTTPAFTDEVIHLYLATQLEPVPAAPEEDEVIQVLRLPLSEALTWIRSGRITDGKTVVALLMAPQAAAEAGATVA